MKKSRLKVLTTAALGSLLVLVPAMGLAHGHHHHGHKVVVVKPAVPRTTVVVVRRTPRRHCHYPCWYGPRRAAVHALVDYAWWESTH
jgi:hypothetical protein